MYILYLKTNIFEEQMLLASNSVQSFPCLGIMWEFFFLSASHLGFPRYCEFLFFNHNVTQKLYLWFQNSLS